MATPNSFIFLTATYAAQRYHGNSFLRYHGNNHHVNAMLRYTYIAYLLKVSLEGYISNALKIVYEKIVINKFVCGDIGEYLS
jgi:hypothetical protein